MRKVSLDLHKDLIVLCEVSDGKVVCRRRAKRLDDLVDVIGPGTPTAKIAFEAGRSAWHVHDKLSEWGHQPIILDTTRIRAIGVGQHRRKNDEIDAETIARALEKGYVFAAHTLSEPRRELRRLLSIRYGFVSARTQHINIVRGLALSEGVDLTSCDADDFAPHARAAQWSDKTRAQIEPAIAIVESLTRAIHDYTKMLHDVAAKEPVTALLATTPFVALIGAATFVSVVDDADRFRRASTVASYLGLVPSENTSNSAPRLGAITKAGNPWARAALVEAAWGLLDRGDPSDPLVAWGRMLVVRRNKFVAAVAVARKLAGILWAMWKRNQPYDPKRLALASSEGLEENARRVSAHSEAMASLADDAGRERQINKARKKLRAAYKARLTSEPARKQPTSKRQRERVTASRPTTKR